MEKLTAYLKGCKNVTFRENTEVRTIEEKEDKVEFGIRYEVEKVYGKKAIICSGKWVKSLLPEISSLFKVIRQYVAFIKIEGMEKYKLDNFPCFAHMNQAADFFYLPSVGDEGFKIGLHNVTDSSMTSERFENLVRENAVQLFGKKFLEIKKIEECFYTVTRTEDFVLDWVNSESEKILAVSCCSGHGFKFCPILGKVAADVAHKNTSIDIF